MSTKFGVLREKLDIEVGDENGVFNHISDSAFEEVWFRSMGRSRWLNDLAPLLPDDVKVYALDNSQQGVYTIGDIKKLMQNDSIWI